MLNGSACLTIFERVRYCVLTVLVTWYLLYLFHNNVVWFAFGVSGLLLSSCPKDIPHLFCHRMLRLHMRVSNTHHSRFRQPKPDSFHFIERFVCLWQIRKSWKSNIKSRKTDWLFGLVKLQISLFCLDDLFNSKNETTQPCMFWNSQQIPMIFSVKVFRLNVLQTFSRVVVGVTRRYNGGNQVIWYWTEQILRVDNESIKAKLYKHNTGTMLLMQKMGLQ